MSAKREYEEAFDLINIFTSCGCNEVDDCNCCIAYNKRPKQQHGCELDLALNMFKELIDEHFELLDGIQRIIDKAKELSNSNDELRRQLYFIEPYNFEDLKSNMWIWDNAAKECLYVIKPFVGSFTGAKYFSYLGIYKNLEEIKKLDIKFEENRFFPVRCANLES